MLEVGLAEASATEVCRYADEQGRIVTGKDEDFLHLANRPEAATRVLWVRLGNCRTSTLIAAFEEFWPIVESFLKAGDRIIEIR